MRAGIFIMISRKGFEQSMLVAAIVALVIILVLGFLGYNVFKSINETTNKEICKQSVQQHDLLKVRGVDLSESIKCPTTYVTITEKEDAKIKRELANEMYDCWDIFGQGKLELFKDDKIYCAVCSVIDFESKNKQVEGLGSYLVDTNIPNTDLTYYDFLAGYETSKAKGVASELTAEQRRQVDSETIDTSKKYATIFVYARGRDNIRIIVDHVTGATPEGALGGIGLGVGAAAAIAGVVFLSGPVGWAVTGAGITFAVLSEVGTFMMSSDNRPEWFSMTMLREYNADTLKQLGCQELPVEQKT